MPVSPVWALHYHLTCRFTKGQAALAGFVILIILIKMVNFEIHTWTTSPKPAADMITDAVVVALAVAGTPETCRESLERMIESGITAPALFFPPPTEFAQAARAVSQHLLPHLL